MNGGVFSSNLNWPEDYGFWIYGPGPTYVIYVEQDSIAAKSGITSGDRIVELDHKNVSNYSSDAIKSLVNASTNQAPFVSVQSALRHAQLISKQNFGIGKHSFGLRYDGTLPVIIDAVEPDQPAYLAGLRKGDLILFANNLPIKNSYDLKMILDANTIVDIKYIRMLDHTSYPRAYSDREVSQDFYEAVNKHFMHDKMKRDLLLNELARYNQFGDIDSLELSLRKLLVNSNDRKIINLIKPLISPMHYQQLETLYMQKSGHEYKYNDTFRQRKKNKRSNSHKKYRYSSESSSDSDEVETKIYSDIGKSDRLRLKKLVSSYIKTKNFDKLYHNVAKMCQSKTKPDVWEYICPMLDCEHRQCLKERLMKRSCPKIDMCCSRQNVMPRPKVYFVEPCEPVYCEPKFLKSKIYSSAPSLDCSIKDKFSYLMEQLKCHLNSHECLCIRQALCDYDRNKNFCQFLYKVNRIFNTANKRSLWSKLVCFLDEPDQEYAMGEYYSTVSKKCDQSRNKLVNCDCSRLSLKSPKYSSNTYFYNDKNKKPRSKSLFRWEPESDEELKRDRISKKLNFAETAVSDHEYFVYDTDTEIYESEEHNIEFEMDKTLDNFNRNLNFDNSKRTPIYSKSFSNFNKVAL